jgi:hypothetical protein
VTRRPALSSLLALGALFAALHAAAPRGRAQDTATTPPSATAATPPADDAAARFAEGRAAYARGLAAADEVRWGDALREFERAYALARVPSALFNVATTLRALGRHVEARDTLTRLLRDHELDAETQAEAARLLREESTRVARLRVSGLPAIDRLELRLDGRLTPLGTARPLELSVDAGAHVVEASAPAHTAARWEGTLVDGAVEDITLTPTPLALPRPTPAPAPAPAPRASGGSSAWIWITLAVVVVAGAGVGVGLYLQDDAQLDPTPGRVAVNL